MMQMLEGTFTFNEPEELSAAIEALWDAGAFIRRETEVSLTVAGPSYQLAEFSLIIDGLKGHNQPDEYLESDISP